MTALWFAGATLMFVVACYVYFRCHFIVAAILALLFVASMLKLSFPASNPILWTLVTVFIVIGPMILLTWHTIDQHFGIFMLPTVYSIPLAIVCSGILWLYCGTVLLWSAFS